MSLEAAVYDILKSAAGVTALVGGTSSPRIYPLAAPAGKTGGVVVYQQITSDEQVATDGPVGLRTDRVQVNCWADTPAAARSLAEAVRTALAAASGSHGSVTVIYGTLEDEGDLANLGDESEELTRYGKRQEWEIAYQP